MFVQKKHRGEVMLEWVVAAVIAILVLGAIVIAVTTSADGGADNVISCIASPNAANCAP